MISRPEPYSGKPSERENSLGRNRKSITQKQLEVLSARVNYDLYKRIETIAQERDLTITQVVREAIRKYVGAKEAA